MADPRFAVALAFTLPWEGDYSNDPADPGGATQHGVTQRTYTAWLMRQKLPVAPVKDMPPAHEAAIYEEDYWTPCGHGLPAPLDLVAFDTAVNCGVARTQEWLANGWHPTGDVKAAARNICDARENHYVGLIARRPVMAKYRNGWMRRLNALRQAAGLL